MDNALLFSDSFSVRLILDTYRSDQFTIVKLVGEHQPSLSPSPKFFVRFLLPPGISMSGLEKSVLFVYIKLSVYSKMEYLIFMWHWQQQQKQHNTIGETCYYKVGINAFVKCIVVLVKKQGALWELVAVAHIDIREDRVEHVAKSFMVSVVAGEVHRH